MIWVQHSWHKLLTRFNSWSFGRWWFASNQLVCCLTITAYSATYYPCLNAFIRAYETSGLTVVESDLETAWVDGADIQSGARGCQAKPGHASSTEGFSAAGHWGEGAWHLISYHSEFCYCHWHLATEKQSKDDGCCWTQLGFHVTVAVRLYQVASRLIQADIPLQTSVQMQEKVSFISRQCEISCFHLKRIPWISMPDSSKV